jgi:hypothetical protein
MLLLSLGTQYFRDTTAVLSNMQQHRMWLALEAGSGVVSEHDYDPNSYCTDGFNGCFEDNNPGAWWNVTSDPFDDDESPLWAFTKYRALNRLALRTKLAINSSNSDNIGNSGNIGSTAGVDGYTTFEHANSYEGHGGTEIDTSPKTGLSADQCAARCTSDQECDCVTFCAANSGCSPGDCWMRSKCDPTKFDVRPAASAFTVYVKKNAPTPAPAVGGGALAYLKHDSMGPRGDAAILVFNPGVAQKVTIDLSMLPASLYGTVPYDLLTHNGTIDMDTDAVPPLAKSWTVSIAKGEMKFFGGFSLGVFAPRQGKKASCTADDQYSKPATSTTLEGCFMECASNSKCANVLVDFVDIQYTEKPPPMSCTLLGAVKDPSSACKEGKGTLINKLPGARSCAHLWSDSGGESPPPARGSPPLAPGPASPACPL